MSLELLGVCLKLSSDRDKQRINIFLKINENCAWLSLFVRLFPSSSIGEVVCVQACWIVHKLLCMQAMESLQMQDGTGMLHRQDLSMVMPEPSHGFEPICPV